ncbi:TELO2-interacting protein 1 homolog [Amyelois transitella]|uniref:TELO2-interacting protein 1 homolog n=1 Tax=Amyelois transitella TaxID=680683 RepID=UPI00067B43DE|nr:TELO2-interacting protein 1 homolog [Amyelois transitella]
MFKMKASIKGAFANIKPVCDEVMVCPSPESIAAYTASVSQLKKEVVQELQQYLLFPFITHIHSTEIEKKYDLQCLIVDAMRAVLERVTVNSFDMCMKIETGLVQLVFDNSKPGMVSDAPEELKHSVMQTLTVLLLNLDKPFRDKLYKTQVPMLAQIMFVSVHIAKLEKLRALRLSAINCLSAHTGTHAQLSSAPCPPEEGALVSMLAAILPGVLAALQDVATALNNPGHAVVVAAINAIHRILCTVMHEKHLKKKTDITVEDIAKMVREKATVTDTEVSRDNLKDLPKCSPEWYEMAGKKLVMITTSLASLRTHEHWRVRKELAIYCYRLLTECHTSMLPSVPMALDILISLAKDEYPEVAEYCTNSVNAYFRTPNKLTAMDGLSKNLMTALANLPRIINNIDSSRKLSALNLLHGYIQVMADGSRPQQLTTALSVQVNMQSLCSALVEAATVQTDLNLLSQYTVKGNPPPPHNSPWLNPRHLDPTCEQALRDICRCLSEVECAELILDNMLDLFHAQRKCEHVALMNWMITGVNTPVSLSRRVLDAYLSPELWSLPLQVVCEEHTAPGGTYDIRVYNSRSWHKDSVPGLYEGAVEMRYTGVSYDTPRSQPARDPNSCATLKEAQNNVALTCLITEGVGIAARRLGQEFQPYLMKTLCPLLERAGSKYGMVYLAGLKAINDVAIAMSYGSVAHLIRQNADYFTSQISTKLKRAWNNESALLILTVVMEYSDSNVLDCLYGIVEDVLVQSCDKYYEMNLELYLKVFVTFMECILRWFPVEEVNEHTCTKTEIDLFGGLSEYIQGIEEAERLMNSDEFERSPGQSVEEMYREDLQKNDEEDILDYDDTVTVEKPPLPQHVRVTITVIKRCVNFVTSRRLLQALLAMRVLSLAFPVLGPYEDELLPLVHQSWAPLVTVMETGIELALRRAVHLMLVLASLSKDFILSRAEKDVLPHMYFYLKKSAVNSLLKDVGAAYRNTHAYYLQMDILTVLPKLAIDLKLDGKRLDEAMESVYMYLSNKQPSQLQQLAVDFYQAMLGYDYAAAWHHLRTLCENTRVLEPPKIPHMALEKIIGTPYESNCEDYNANIQLIFNL